MKRVIFVGGFSVPEDGTEGGQVFACRSLLASPLSDLAAWILIDSTQRSNPPPSFVVRAWDAGKRLMQLIYSLLFRRADALLIFSSLRGVSIYEKGLMCVLGRAFGKRVVLSTRSHPKLADRFPRIFQNYVRFSMRCCDQIICQSELGRAELSQLFSVDCNKIHIVPNWIDPVRFSDQPVPDTKNMGRPKKQLLYVGWLHPVKGLPYLLEAVRDLAIERNDFTLVLYGGGQSEPELRCLAKSLAIEPVVQFGGWLANEKVPDAMRNADIFVFPTLHEGMPNSLLQAMACGLPIVSTNVTSIPEIVEDQVSGLLVDPHSPNEICDALRCLLNDDNKRQSMAAVNRQRILDHHTVNAAWPIIGQLVGIK